MYDDDVLNFTNHELSLVIDSGASIHVISRRHLFTTYTTDDYQVIKMGNDGVSEIFGIEDVYLETNNEM